MVDSSLSATGGSDAIFLLLGIPHIRMHLWKITASLADRTEKEFVNLVLDSDLDSILFRFV